MPIHTYICVYRRVQENVVDSKSVTLVPGDHGITYMCVCVYVYVCVCVCIHINFESVPLIPAENSTHIRNRT